MAEPRAFTDKEKLDAVQREIRMRRRVYPRRVQDNLMTADEAEWQIGIFEAIAKDYRDKIQPNMI